MLLTVKFFVRRKDFLQEEAEGAEFVDKKFSLLPLLPPVNKFAEKNSFFCFWLRPWAALGH